MENSFGQHGWREFQRNRKNILGEYDRLIELTTNRPVKIAHGVGVEAYIRNWLTEFLPKKYGVTSGYIIPTLYGHSNLIYHFDIIIYNQLDSPVLWTEGNKDSSDQGQSRAIPAKHVAAVLEVKSRLTKDNIDDALEKLQQVEKFSQQLPQEYFSGVCFVELKNSENQSKSILQALHRGRSIFGFQGGIVLRYEGDETASGYITLYEAKSENTNKFDKPQPLAMKIEDIDIRQMEDGNLSLNGAGCGALMIATGETWGVSKTYTAMYESDGKILHLAWSRNGFTVFCIDLMSRLDGRTHYENNRYSFGMVFDSIKQQPAQQQPATPREGYPFLEVGITDGEPDGQSHKVHFEENIATIDFWIEVKNSGEADAVISDNGFDNSFTLHASKRATKKVTFKISPKKTEDSVAELFSGEGLDMTYRIVYKTANENRDFYAITRNLRIKTDSISILES